MIKKFLKILLIIVCQIFLLTGIIFADSNENKDSYFKFKTFEEMKPEFAKHIDSKYIDVVEKLYKEFYKLEEERKYFKADEKLEELDDKIADIYEATTGKQEWSKGDFPIDFYNNMVETRDYRYGLPSFEEAYELEFKDYTNLIEEDKRERFKNEVKRIYEKVERHYNELKDKGNNQGLEDNPYAFGRIRDELSILLLAYKERKNLIYTKDRVCVFNNVCYLKPENFNAFLESNKDIIGEDKVKRIRQRHEKAYEIIESREDLKSENITCRQDIFVLEISFKEDKQIEEVDQLFEETQGMLRTYRKKICNPQFRDNKKAIENLYEEINKESN